MLVREGDEAVAQRCTMRAELIDHFEPCMTDIYLHIYARMADYIHTHPQPGSAEGLGAGPAPMPLTFTDSHEL